MTIQELEDLIKAAPDKTLPVHIWCNDLQLRASVKEVRLEEKELIFVERDDEIPDFDLGIGEEDDEDEEE
jgi:hypothetical protein